ncbi:MAG: DNA ligase D [Gemmatimonadaceae bacterium]
MSPRASSSLATYRKKRDFARTTEPKGGTRAKARRKALEFVIQKHDASQLHFDLRLELDGVMKSWAVPKGPCLDPKVKRLAMQVEDHPMEYSSFEGTIPEGEYGGGTVMIWDRGTYESDDGGGVAALRTGLRDGKLEVTLQGERVTGAFTLVRMARGNGKEWLLLKRDDESASRRGDVVKRESTSVVSGRTMAAISKSDRVWRSDRAEGSDATGSDATGSDAKAGKASGGEATGGEATGGKARVVDAKKSRAPGSPSSNAGETPAPMLATSASALPSGEGWVFEPKYDGIRILAFVAGDEVQLLTRNGIDRRARYPEVADALVKLSKRRRRSLVLDGEVVGVVGTEAGRFQTLHTHPTALMLFDILMDGERSLVQEPWSVRRKALERVTGTLREDALRLGTVEREGGAALLATATRDGWEGIMAKRADAPYAVGRRSRDWLKLKVEAQQEFVVGGWTEPRNARAHLGALLLGYWKNGKLMYAGHTGGGFTRKGLAEMYALLEPLERLTSPFITTPSTNAEAHWTRPQVVVQVKFNEWTKDGLLRQPIFVGIREDKDPRAVRRESSVIAKRSRRKDAARKVAATGKSPPKSPAKSRKKTAANSRTKTAPKGVVALLDAIEAEEGEGSLALGRGVSLRVTSLDKRYFRKAGKTKGDALRYYADIAPHILPLISDRPLVLRRYPGGIEKPAFFQQKAPDDPPRGVRVSAVEEDGGEREPRLIAGNLMTLLYCVQLGAIDVNPWHSRMKTLGAADYSIIDLDPGPGASFKRVVQVARWVKEVLDELELHGAVKTSGASGLHVYVPLPRRTSYDTSLLVAQVVATKVAEQHPREATVLRSVKKRPSGTVYVDYLQNVKGKSVASVLSLRAQPAASVSFPLTWDELTDDLDPRDFTIDTVPADAKARAAAWSKVLAKPVILRTLRHQA